MKTPPSYDLTRFRPTRISGSRKIRWRVLLLSVLSALIIAAVPVYLSWNGKLKGMLQHAGLPTTCLVLTVVFAGGRTFAFAVDVLLIRREH